MFKVTNDKFFAELSQNYAQIIYKIVGMDWNIDESKPEKKLSLRRLKKIICKADGYERDMLALMYGATGIMSLDEKTQFL